MPDLKGTIQEFRQYFASSYESHRKIAARAGVTPATFVDADGQPATEPKTLAKLRAFLDAEAKRNLARQLNQTDRAGAAKNRKTRQASAVPSALSLLSEDAGQDSQAKRYFVPGRLPEVWSVRTEARKRSGPGLGGSETG